MAEGLQKQENTNTKIVFAHYVKAKKEHKMLKIGSKIVCKVSRVCILISYSDWLFQGWRPQLGPPPHRDPGTRGQLSFCTPAVGCLNAYHFSIQLREFHGQTMCPLIYRVFIYIYFRWFVCLFVVVKELLIQVKLHFLCMIFRRQSVFKLNDTGCNWRLPHQAEQSGQGSDGGTT